LADGQLFVQVGAFAQQIVALGFGCCGAAQGRLQLLGQRRILPLACGGLDGGEVSGRVCCRCVGGGGDATGRGNPQ